MLAAILMKENEFYISSLYAVYFFFFTYYTLAILNIGCVSEHPPCSQLQKKGNVQSFTIKYDVIFSLSIYIMDDFFYHD